MAFAHCLVPVAAEPPPPAIPKPPITASSSPLSSSSAQSASGFCKFEGPRFPFTGMPLLRVTVKAKPQESEVSVAADAFTEFKNLFLPITDSNPYLSEGTRQAAATAASLAKKYGASITVVVIDEKQKESLPELETQLASIRWHLSEGGFQEFQLLERRGEGKKPTAIIGEIADDLGLDLVVLSMEAIHSKHVDANLLAEFIPCPVLLLPL